MQTEEIMPRTLAQKIWHDHHVTTRNDGRQLIYMDRHVIHELHQRARDHIDRMER